MKEEKRKWKKSTMTDGSLNGDKLSMIVSIIFNHGGPGVKLWQ